MRLTTNLSRRAALAATALALSTLVGCAGPAEETDQAVVLGDLVRVQTQRWVGRSPRDRIEDYQAVRLVYRADCPAPTTPRVLDVGGTTESARWIGLDNWRSMPWTADWRAMLAEELGPQRA